MDDHLTISFGDDGERRPHVTPEMATVCREVDDTTRGEVVWRSQESVTGFGEGHRYQLIREIGRGGMGIVHQGWDSQLCRSVAIKIIDPSQRLQPAGLPRFFREARIASQLSHPGIVTIHEFGVTLEGEAFIVMELLLGRTLRQILKSVGDRGRELPGLLTAFSEVCQAMASAHGRGVIHRDLKPSNVMVCPFGVVSVMDWGVAKLLSDAGSSDGFDAPAASTTGANTPPADVRPAAAPGTGDQTAAAPEGPGHTLAGTIFGTPAYLPPEQARGEIDRVDCRSDVFGLGSVLCEILTGTAPFAAESADDRCRQAADGDLGEAFARLDGCGGPLPLISLAKRCLAAEPAARPADAGEVATAVTTYLESGQRRAEQELVRFFDLSLDLFCIAGLNGIFHRLNDNVESLLGYTADELVNQPILDYVHPDDHERTCQELAHLAEQRPTIQFVNRYRHADGRYVWLEWNARAVAEESAVYAVARDISERMAAAELRATMERERETIAAFAAAAGLFLTASGSLVERLGNVVEEGVSLLGLQAMEVWQCDGPEGGARLLTASNPDAVSASPRILNAIIEQRQPQQRFLDSSADDPALARLVERGVRSFVGYPLLVGDRPVGLLAVYAKESLSEMHVMAMSTTVASLALAIAADARPQ
ncbi:MAG: protein kinase [Pirellulales bacterium]|nr:protein kinase [Pirellulales bacterium]